MKSSRRFGLLLVLILAVGVLDAANQGGRVQLSAICEDPVGCRQSEERDFTGTQYE